MILVTGVKNFSPKVDPNKAFCLDADPDPRIRNTDTGTGTYYSTRVPMSPDVV